MARPHSIYRTTAALILLAAACVAMVLLGRWQLHRAAERQGIAAAIEAGRQLPPLTLTPSVDASELTAWRNAQATGTWIPEKSVLLENRNYNGHPGYWIATPLLIDARTQAAVLVLRGWMPRSMSAQGHPPVPPVQAPRQTVQGELALHVPRLYELGDGQYSRLPDQLGESGTPPAVQNLSLADYAQASGLNMMPVVLQQLTPSEDGLMHDWPQPSIDHNQNYGYALQWFAFASIAGVAFLVVLWRAARRGRKKPSATDNSFSL